MEFYLTFLIFGFMMFMMSLGYIFTKKELKGSCGGVGASCPCDEAGTPGACKTDSSAPEAGSINLIPSSSSQSTQLLKRGEDGVSVYGPSDS